MDHQTIDALRQRHVAWRLLRAGNASLILSFLGDFFVASNRGAAASSELAAALDDRLVVLNGELTTETGEPRYPKLPRAYLEDWAAAEAGFLRRFYPPGDDEVNYEVTPAFEKAYAWVGSLQSRAFVGTESRLHTVVELLRQIVNGTEADPNVRLMELRRRRAEIEAEIAAAESGVIPLLDATGVRDRFQQLSSTARELLTDFREVEENFRRLDRSAREQIASWDGAKGALLEDLVGGRSQITGSDQGRSFAAFYEFLLSGARQEELGDLLARASALEAVEKSDARLLTIHHDWSEAAERAQRTVRQISEQLRRFLDDQVWLENRRVVDLVRAVESAALEVREHPPTFGLEVDEPGLEIVLPFDRPLYQPNSASEVESVIPAIDDEVDTDLLFRQTFIDRTRLLANVRAAMPPRSSALLADIIALYPIEQGAAEIVGYLALDDEAVVVELDGNDQTLLEYADPAVPEAVKRARLPKVTVTRR